MVSTADGAAYSPAVPQETEGCGIERMAEKLRATVAKNGPVVKEGLKQVVEDTGTVVKPTLSVYRSNGFVVSVLYVVRCFVGLVLGFLTGLRAGKTLFDRALGWPIVCVSYVDERICNQCVCVDETVEKTRPFNIGNKYGAALRDISNRALAVCGDYVLDKLPKVNFDQENISRLGEWFCETVGHTRMWSRVSQIYGGKISEKEE